MDVLHHCKRDRVLKEKCRTKSGEREVSKGRREGKRGREGENRKEREGERSCY